MKTRKLQRRRVSIICLVALLATALVNGLAQDRGSGTKRSLTHHDYDSWRSIQAPQISRDGKFIAYAFMAQDGDSETPEWMQKGIPYLQREKEKEKYPVTDEDPRR